jgi:predicted amidohydrolase
MHITALVAQFPVSLSIQQNLESIQRVLEHAQPGDLVVLPEGSISGYSHDLSFLKTVDRRDLKSGLASLRAEAQKRRVHLWVGACLYKGESWFNAAIGYGPDGERSAYHKINLANHERDTFTAGSALPVFHLNTSSGTGAIGVQICRELRFPEQWGWLARRGAQIILHLNNAVGHAWNLPVWRSHLISRAAETQRFVLSANNAAPEQNSPTIAVAPDGQVLGEILSDRLEVMRVDLDLSLVSNWYLDQCRTDLVTIGPGENAIRRKQQCSITSHNPS